jgi:hypothetical protein
MSPDSIFSICSSIAMIGWIILIFIPWWTSADRFIIGIIIALLAIVYAYLMFGNFSFSDISQFGSLSGVIELFRNPAVVTAGWIHYLAFDLLAGIFIRKNAWKYNISHWLVIPCLLLTFMFGPVGLLLYLLIRTTIVKRYFTENF